MPLHLHACGIKPESRLYILSTDILQLNFPFDTTTCIVYDVLPLYNSTRIGFFLSSWHKHCPTCMIEKSLKLHRKESTVKIKKRNNRLMVTLLGQFPEDVMRRPDTALPRHQAVSPMWSVCAGNFLALRSFKVFRETRSSCWPRRQLGMPPVFARPSSNRQFLLVSSLGSLLSFLFFFSYAARC